MLNYYFIIIICIIHIFSINGEIASFPLKVTADIRITAHQVDESSDYPPRIRNMKVYYDYLGKKCRAEIDEGYEAAKVYIRRYDLKNEYMVRLPPIDDCKRSYLGDKMPFPDIPFETSFQGKVNMNSVDCNYYLFDKKA